MMISQNQLLYWLAVYGLWSNRPSESCMCYDTIHLQGEKKRNAYDLEERGADTKRRFLLNRIS